MKKNTVTATTAAAPAVDIEAIKAQALLDAKAEIQKAEVESANAKKAAWQAEDVKREERFRKAFDSLAALCSNKGKANTAIINELNSRDLLTISRKLRADCQLIKVIQIFEGAVNLLESDGETLLKDEEGKKRKEKIDTALPMAQAYKILIDYQSIIHKESALIAKAQVFKPY
jgi:hypothetical protein